MTMGTSPRMAEDVIVHGDLIEFLHLQRCEACQTRNRKCIIKRGDEGCLLCTDAERACVFARFVQLRGPASNFRWDTLLGKVPSIQVQENNVSTWNGKEVLGLDHPPTPDISAMTQSGHENHRPTAQVLFHARLLPQGTKLRYLLKKVLTLCTAVLAFRDAGRGNQGVRVIQNSSPLPVQLFDNRMNPLKHKRRLSESARKKAAQTRRVGACDSCRQKKRRCEHALASINSQNGNSAEISDHQILGNSAIAASSSGLGVNSRGVESSQADDQERNKNFMTPASLVTSPYTSSENVEVPTRSKTPHHESLKPMFKCIQCDQHPEGFRGEYGLLRHRERAHSKIQNVWVCVDASSDGTLFAHCKACTTGKKYQTQYNAITHLRRAHFNKKLNGQHGKNLYGNKKDFEEIESGKVPLNLLQLYVRKFEVMTDDKSIESLSHDMDEAAGGQQDDFEKGEPLVQNELDELS